MNYRKIPLKNHTKHREHSLKFKNKIISDKNKILFDRCHFKIKINMEFKIKMKEKKQLKNKFEMK